MSKHTPGPWKWDADVCNYDPNNEAPWLVDVNDSYPPILGGSITCKNPANARLIAAAPDLLEALKTMVKEFGYDVVHDRGMVHDEHEAIRSAINAIAKAEGSAT